MPHSNICCMCRRLAGEDKARVFATDTVLTTLMCAARSVYSWDVVVTRAGKALSRLTRIGWLLAAWCREPSGKLMQLIPVQLLQF